jgi:phosphoribosylglycinamide formyltransferase 1
MRILSAGFVEHYRGCLLNIHPSLLPSFPGLSTHRRALEAGVRFHGATVHFVTQTLDHGPIVDQAVVPVFEDDVEETLAQRVLWPKNTGFTQRQCEVLLKDTYGSMATTCGAVRATAD